MGESEKLEGVVPRTGRLATDRLSECDQPRLLWVNGQPEAGNPLRQYGHEPAGIVFQLAADDKVIGKANQKAAAFHPGLHVAHEPLIQHVMQEYIAQHGREDPSYNIAKRSLEFLTTIPRERLRASYGQGFRGAPLQSDTGAGRSPQGRPGGRRGTTRTTPKKNRRGPREI